MGDINKSLGVAVIGYLDDDNLDAICGTWSKLRAMEYARQLGLGGEEYKQFVLSNYESMAPQRGEDAIKLMMFVMELANGREAGELGAIIMKTVGDEVIHAMPFEDAHEALRHLWNNVHSGRVEAPAIAEFLGMREDAEQLIFWNAPLRDWGMGEGSAFQVGPWMMGSGNLFFVSCLMIQDEIIAALGGLYTPHMSVALPSQQPDGGSLSYTPLESAIWITASANPDPDAGKEADRKLRRRRIIDLLIAGGASLEKVQLSRAAYLPSEGDPMEAAQQAGNDEAVAAILHARSKATEKDILGVTVAGNSRNGCERGGSL